MEGLLLVALSLVVAVLVLVMQRFLDSSTIGGTRAAAVGLLVVLVPLSLVVVLVQRFLGGTSAAAVGRRLPPTPRLAALPVLGHIHLVWRVCSSPTALQGMHHKLGPIFTLRLGRTPVIFVASAALLQEALVSPETGLLFAARPRLHSRALFTHNFRSINSASYSPLWRSLRRNLVHHMLAPASLDCFHAARAHSLHILLDRLHSQSLLHHGLASFFPACKLSMLHLLFFMCFGFHVSDDVIDNLATILEGVISFSLGKIGDFFPLLRFFDVMKLHKELPLRRKQIRFFSSYIQNHKELHKLGKLTPCTYLETLLRIDIPTSTTALSNTDLVTLCTEFLIAGTYTTTISLEWTMAHLVNDPVMQSKLYSHIHDVVGDRILDEDDLPQSSYLQAVIKESLRLHPPSHFLLPHAVAATTQLAGYEIPPDAIIHFHLPSISRDPSIWEEPLAFRPERFLARDVDIIGTKETSMLPFGAGRRTCPGQHLVMMEMELFVGRLVQAFKWSSPSPGYMVDLSENMTMAFADMKHSLRAHLALRKNDGT